MISYKMPFFMRIIMLISFFLLFTAVTLSGRDLKLGINN